MASCALHLPTDCSLLGQLQSKEVLCSAGVGSCCLLYSAAEAEVIVDPGGVSNQTGGSWGRGMPGPQAERAMVEVST